MWAREVEADRSDTGVPASELKEGVVVDLVIRDAEAGTLSLAARLLLLFELARTSDCRLDVAAGASASGFEIDRLAEEDILSVKVWRVVELVLGVRGTSWFGGSEVIIDILRVLLGRADLPLVAEVWAGLSSTRGTTLRCDVVSTGEASIDLAVL